MCAQNGAGIQCLFHGSITDNRGGRVQAHAKPPLGAGVILGLYGAQPLDNIRRLPDGRC